MQDLRREGRPIKKCGPGKTFDSLQTHKDSNRIGGSGANSLQAPSDAASDAVRLRLAQHRHCAGPQVGIRRESRAYK